MDQYGPLPVTLGELSRRLERGEVFSIQSDTFEYALFLDAQKHVILRQGSQEQPFRQLEVAVLTLLCCMGSFDYPQESEETSTDEFANALITKANEIREEAEKAWNQAQEDLAAYTHQDGRRATIAIQVLAKVKAKKKELEGLREQMRGGSTAKIDQMIRVVDGIFAQIIATEV